jgi:hypothetical protein
MLRRLRMLALTKLSPVKVGSVFYATPMELGYKGLRNVQMFDDVRLTCVGTWRERFYFRVDALQLSPPGPEVWLEVAEQKSFWQDDFHNLILDGIVRKKKCDTI